MSVISIGYDDHFLVDDLEVGGLGDNVKSYWFIVMRFVLSMTEIHQDGLSWPYSVQVVVSGSLVSVLLESRARPIFGFGGAVQMSRFVI